jgi:hypothetical protein
MPNMTGYSPFWRLAEHVPVDSLQRTLLPSEHPLNTLQPIDMQGREFFPYTVSNVPISRRAGDDPLGAQRPPLLRTLIEVHKRADSLLGAVLPAQIGYRLFVECRARQ